MGTEETDEALMLRYAAGDVAAFERLYARHRAGLYRYLKRQCSEGAVEELFQDVWMRVIAARERYQPDAKFATYLYRIAHNRLVDWYRARARGRESLESAACETTLAPSADPGPEQLLESTRRAARVRGAVAALPAEQRDAFLLHEEGGLSLEEIGDVTGVGRETVKSRLRYALAKLREALEATHA